MLRCGFGLKDAPRLWNKVLKRVLEKLGLEAHQSDQQLYSWHVEDNSSSTIHIVASDDVQPKRLALIISTHVDDLKGAGEDVYRRKLLTYLEHEFGKLKNSDGTWIAREDVLVLYNDTQSPATGAAGVAWL